MRKSFTFLAKLGKRRPAAHDKEAENCSFLSAPALCNAGYGDTGNSALDTASVKQASPPHAEHSKNSKTSSNEDAGPSSKAGVRNRYVGRNGRTVEEIVEPRGTRQASPSVEEMLQDLDSHAGEDAGNGASEVSSAGAADDEDISISGASDSAHQDSEGIVYEEGCLEEVPALGSWVTVLYADNVWHVGLVVATSGIEATIRYQDETEDTINVEIDAVRLVELVIKDSGYERDDSVSGTLHAPPPVGTRVKILCEDSKWYLCQILSSEDRIAKARYELDDMDEELEFNAHYIRSIDYIGEDEDGPPIGRQTSGDVAAQRAAASRSGLRAIAESNETCPSDPTSLEDLAAVHDFGDMRQ